MPRQKLRLKAGRQQQKTRRRGRLMTTEDSSVSLKTAIEGVSVMPRRRRPKEPLSIDSAWFNDRLRARGLSQRAAASIIGRHASIFSRSLKGARRFDVDDIVSLRSVLQCSSDEILRRLGYPVESQGVPIVGKITSDGRISTVTGRKGGQVSLPDMPADAKAYVVEADSGALAAYADAAVIVQEGPAGGTVKPEVFGRLCIVEADPHLTPVLGVLGKAPQRGSVALTMFQTAEAIQLQKIHRCSEVLAIVFL